MPAIGIDLGTTNSCVAVVQQGKVTIIANDQGQNTTPSWVSFTAHDRIIGYHAKSQIAMNPQDTVYDVKRLIGRRFTDPSVTFDRKNWSFQVVPENDKPMISVDYKGEKRKFSAEEVSSMILVYMKEMAENYLGEEVTDAVITVPAYFDISQRQATKDAGTIAGLNVLRIISEPTAAAISYGLSNTISTERNVLIYDLGGGTLDVSVLKIKDGEIKVKSTDGDTHLGGEDFDDRMLNSFITDFELKNHKDIRGNKRAVSRLRAKCEQAKWALSSTVCTNVDVDCLFEGIDFNSEITRARFEELNGDLFESTIDSVENCLRNAGMDRDDIDDIVVVGGSTRIPKIQQLLKDYFNGRQLNHSINPDEAVAYGAAVQAAMLSDGTSVVAGVGDLFIEDVVPLSLGFEVIGRVMSVLIPRNTPIPFEKTGSYTTTRDDQKSFSIVVYEGERAMTKDNRFLDEFLLTDIPLAPRGVPKIDVTFKLDENSILHVSAVNRDTKKQQRIVVAKYEDRLPQETIDRMVSDAERFKMDDTRQRQRVAAKNELESYAYRIKSTMMGVGAVERIPKSDRENLIEKCNCTITWLRRNEFAQKDEIRQQLRELEHIAIPIMRRLS